ncbi:MAG: hypothetical protein IKI44_05890, partial [Bacteroidaceae bacterium]|nr:hypothetical protein [Bacteroidaceae bacterium]
MAHEREVRRIAELGGERLHLPVRLGNLVRAVPATRHSLHEGILLMAWKGAVQVDVAHVHVPLVVGVAARDLASWHHQKALVLVVAPDQFGRGLETHLDVAIALAPFRMGKLRAVEIEVLATYGRGPAGLLRLHLAPLVATLFQ